MVAAYLKTFTYRMQHRRQELDAAGAYLAAGEALPKIVLLFILFVIPFLFSPAPFHSLGDLLWWVKGWTLVWVVMAAVLYLPIGLVIAPRQLTGASVGAMTQADPVREPVPYREPVADECVLVAPVVEVTEQVTLVREQVCRQRMLRWQPRRQLYFLLLRFIPPHKTSLTKVS
jgi:hypothetical protein